MATKLKIVEHVADVVSAQRRRTSTSPPRASVTPARPPSGSAS